MRIRLRRERLLELLARSNQSQNYWAMRLGLARGHWSEIVNGKHPCPSGRTRERMLEVFAVPFAELFEVEAGSALPDAETEGAIGGRYLVDRELGRGGMGTVFLARDLRLSRAVAVKMVSAEVVSGIGLDRFLREIGYTARLHHPHVLPLYDAGETDGHPYYAMAYLRDGSLRELLGRHPRLPLDRVAGLVRGIAQGLGHAHAHGVLHCDVKPENILLAGDHPYVGDFGIARAIHREGLEWGRGSEIDSSAGTPAYVSPELAAGERDPDARADVYSLAAMTFELLAGRPPFVGASSLDTVARRFKEPPPDPRRFAPEVPAAAADAIGRALSLDREDRQAGTGEFADDLSRAARRGPARLVAGAVFAVSQASGRMRRRLGIPRETLLGAWLRDLAGDMRLAARAVPRAPGFAAVFVLTLGLAIGANATMFGVVDRLILRPPAHIHRPDRVFRVHVARWFEGLGNPSPSMSYAAFRDLRDRSRAFAAVAALELETLSFGSGAEARPVNAGYATGQYFQLLGGRPALGRFFGESEDALPGGAPVAVLGHAFWRTTLGGDLAAIGRTVEIDRRRYEVIGVAPPGFTGTELGRVDVWLPMAALGAGGEAFWEERGWQFLQTFVRLKDGVSETDGAADARRAYHEGHAGYHPYEARAVASLAPLVAGRNRGTGGLESRVAAWLLGMAVIVLLIACANVANLTLARGLTRQAEVAVRQALGGSQGRVLRQLVAEAALLAVSGAALGLGIAAVGAGLVRRTLLPDVAWDRSPVDGRVLLATAGGTLLAVAVGGLLPFARSMRLDLARALHGASKRMATYPRRLLASLLVVQTGLATLLVIGAGLFVTSLRNVEHLDLGVTPEGLLRSRVDLVAAGLSSAEAAEFHRAAAERLRALPGVEHAGAAIGAPFSANYAVGVRVPGQDSLPSLGGGGPYIFWMDAGAINALGLRIIRGRTFTEADDRAGAPPVVVVTDRMARTLWPEADPIGQCVMTSELDYACAPVVGVVADLNRQGLREQPFMALFMPLATAGPDDPPEIMLIRITGPAARMVEPVRRALLEIRPDLPYVSITPFEALVAPHARSWRLGATVFAAFGLLSLVVAGIGVYGVLSFSVARRLPELGIRTALGATSRQVLRLVVGGGLLTAATGVVLGAGLALAFAGRIQALLFDTPARDPIVYLAAGGIIVGLSGAASLVPALRAARADPLTVLRSE